jgi:hypothetical protein
MVTKLIRHLEKIFIVLPVWNMTGRFYVKFGSTDWLGFALYEDDSCVFGLCAASVASVPE